MKSITKLDDEITKTKTKISELTARLKELEREKLEAENFEIVAMVRGIEATPEEFKAFIEAYKKQNEGVATTPGKE